MNPSSAEGRAIQVASPGHACFAAVMIWLGVMGPHTCFYASNEELVEAKAEEPA